MDTFSLAEAKARLSEQISPVRPPRRPIDIEPLRSVSSKTPMQPESAGDFMRRLRDDSRY
jgi:hypothetical protein